jgi:hypothetical protein
VSRASVRQPFLLDHKKTLWLAQAARMSGTRPSLLAGVDDEMAALDFDLACAVRLDIYDGEARKATAILIAQEVAKVFVGER